MAASRLEFGVLGPLVVRVGGVSVRVGGPKQRALLALLLLSANRVVSRERLIGELFVDQGVNSADHALRNHISRLRKVLAPGASDEPRLVARAPGYLLRVEPGELDLERFERLASDGRELLAAGEADAAAASLRAAEALWRGRPLADLELEPFVWVDVERLEELRLAAVEERIDADLALGRHRALVAELEALAIEHRFRERFRVQLMLALYRCGRQAEGLAIYRQTRGLLQDELGLEPGVELQQLERAILVQDPALNPPVDGRRRTTTLPRDTCPFKGLAPFEAADSQFFFGRERLVDELVARLGDAPLVAIVGPSGSGKSSLLRAGLVPALDLKALVIRPDQRPAAQVAEALEQIPTGEPLVLVLDQFEELFAASIPEEERRAFVDAIVDAAWDPERRVLILIALRADFFGHLAPYVELSDLVGQNHVLLGPMSGAELRRAIEGPVECTGLEVEPALVDTLVDEVAGQAGGLPLLSTALLDLWSEREGRSLTLAAYERTGGVRGAVARHSEAAFRSLGDEEQETARRILLRLTAGGHGEALTRRRVTREELDADRDERVARVLATLVESRLLVADNGTVELVHEALLERWPRLRRWLEEDVQGRLVHRHLTQAAGEWNRAGREAGELYRGARLAGALDWASDHPAELNKVEREFLDEGRAASERAAARQRRANRRLLALLGVALALLVLAAVGAVVALQRRAQAQREATTAIAQRLGAQALVDPSLDRSLLLARLAVDLDDTTTTRSNLLAALLRSPAAVGVAHEGSDRLLDEALSPDGRTLAVRGDDGHVAFFDAHSLRLMGEARTQRWKGSPLLGNNQVGLVGSVPAPLHGLAFSSDGRTLVVGGFDGVSATLDLVDAGTYVSGPTTLSSNTIVADVAVAPDGRTLATGEPTAGSTGPPPAVIAIRDARTGSERVATLPIPDGRLAGYTRDGHFLLVSSGPRRSVLFNARTLQRARTFAVGGAGAISPTADQAAFGHPDGTVTVLDLRTGRAKTLSGRASGSVETVGFSRDGRTLATGGADGTVAIWSVRTGALRETFTGHSAPVRGVVFSRDGRTLYTASFDGSVIAWDLEGGRGLEQRFRHPRLADGLVASSVSPDGSLFALSPGPDRVTLWRSRTRTPIATLRGPVGDAGGIAFSPDGKLLAAAGSGNTVVWDTTTRQIVMVLPAAFRAVFSPDGRKLALGLDGGDALYDVRTGRQTGEFASVGSTTGLDFSPDGALLASASLTGKATVWNVATRKEIHELAGSFAAYTLRFSPNGTLVAVGDSSGAVALWDPRSGRRVGVLAAQGGQSVDFDPSGRTLATVTADGKVRLWDVATQELIGALPGSNTGGSVHFFPDGKHVLADFASGAGVIWDVDLADWKAKACTVAGRNLSRAEWRQFVADRPYRTVCP